MSTEKGFSFFKYPDISGRVLIILNYSVIASISQVIYCIYQYSLFLQAAQRTKWLLSCTMVMKKQFKKQSSHLVKGRSGEYKSKVIVHFYESSSAQRVFTISGPT